MMLEKEIREHMDEINHNLENEIPESMTKVIRAVTEDKKEQLRQYGVPENIIQGAYIHVPRNIVNNILNGNVYQEGWSLSKTIWGHNKDFNKRMSEIVAMGVSQGKSSREIALDLEKYVNPDLRKVSRNIQFQKYKLDAQGNIIRDKEGNPVLEERVHTFRFPGVSYNAQRLARTMVAHAYQQAFEHVNEKDPFVQDYIWLSAMQHGRTCEICIERNGQHFKKGELPLDHPNGLCTFIAYIPYSRAEIDNRLIDWIENPKGSDPALDEWLESI